MNISGAIFDLDGTLLDTTEIWEGVAARYITSLRKTPEPGLREKTKAMTLTMLCSYFKGRIPDRNDGVQDSERLQYDPSGRLSGKRRHQAICADPSGKIQAERCCHVHNDIYR